MDRSGGFFSWKVEERFWIVLDARYSMHNVCCLLAACFDPLTYKGGPDWLSLTHLNHHVGRWVRQHTEYSRDWLLEGICLRSFFHWAHLPFLIWLFASPTLPSKRDRTLRLFVVTSSHTRQKIFVSYHSYQRFSFSLMQEDLVVNRLQSFQQN